MGKSLLKVIFENNNNFTTWINLDLVEAKEYYLNKIFDLGIISENKKMCTKVELLEHKSDYFFKIHISKDSPNNPRSWQWTDKTPDNEYCRGVFSPNSHKNLNSAKEELLYYKKGYVYKKRYITNYRNGISETTEEKIVFTL